MGVYFGTFVLLISLVFLIFPKAMSKIMVSSRGVRVRKEKGKIKAGMPKTAVQMAGEKGSKIIIRVIGTILLIISIFAYLTTEFP